MEGGVLERMVVVEEAMHRVLGLAWDVHFAETCCCWHAHPVCLLQEEEAAQRTGGRGLEEIAAEAVMAPEESGGWGVRGGRRVRVAVLALLFAGARRCPQPCP